MGGDDLQLKLQGAIEYLLIVVIVGFSSLFFTSCESVKNVNLAVIRQTKYELKNYKLKR